MADDTHFDQMPTVGPQGLDVQINLNVRGLGRSGTLAINERSAELQ